MKIIGHHVRLVRICPIITIDDIAIVLLDSPPYTSDGKQNGGLWVMNLKKVDRPNSKHFTKAGTSYRGLNITKVKSR